MWSRPWKKNWNFCLGLSRPVIVLLRPISLPTVEALAAVEVINLPLQKLRSNLCGVYCLYLLHLAKKPVNMYKLNQNHLLKQTTEIDVVRFFSENVKKLAFEYKPCYYLQSLSVILWRLFWARQASKRVLGRIFNVTIFTNKRSFPVFLFLWLLLLVPSPKRFSSLASQSMNGNERLGLATSETSSPKHDNWSQSIISHYWSSDWNDWL